QGDVIGSVENGGEVLHRVACTGAVARLQNTAHHLGHGLHVFRVAHLHVHGVDALDGGEVADYGNGNENGFARQLSLAEAFHTLPEGAHHGELQPVHLDDLPYGGAGAAEE